MNEVIATTPPTVKTASIARVALGLSSYKSMCPQTCISLMGLLARRKMTLLLSSGDAFISHSRNTVAEKFLETDCEWLFSVDDDVVAPFGDSAWFAAQTGFSFPEPFASRNILDQLLSRCKTICGAVYFGRTPGGRPTYAEGFKSEAEANYARSGPHDNCKQTRWCGTGALLIHRQVFLDIEERFPRLSRARNNGHPHFFTATEHRLLDQLEKLRDTLAQGAQTGEKSLAAYQHIERIFAESHRQSNLGMGEDVAFAVRAAEAGHQSWIDHSIICGHVGSAVYGPHNTSWKIK